MQKEILLRLSKINKKFPGVEALKQVDLILNGGEVIGLVGENGAGKSTLMKIVSGVYTQTEGDVYINEKKVDITNPATAQNLGIGMVQQEPALAQNLSAADNIFLGKEKTNKKLILETNDMVSEADQLLKEIGAKIDPNNRVDQMSMAQKEAVGIAKAMLLRPKILILDEVTSPLDQEGAEHLFDVIKKLKNTGIGIIFISHRLWEIFEISDRIVVLRDGNKVASLETDKTNQNEIINLMVGNKQLYDKKNRDISSVEKDIVLECRNFCSSKYFSNINLKLKKSEILGLAGLKGAGTSEFAKSLFGLIKKNIGELYIEGRKVNIKNPADAIKVGIGFIPPDRISEGLAEIRNVDENINITILEQLSNILGILNFHKINENANKLIQLLNIKTPSVKQYVRYLSGGNQQKVMIGKWITRELKILIFEEPTRGVDVGAKAEIHKLIVKLRNEGKSIIVISSELPELINLSDRILTIEKGHTSKEFSRNEATEENIMRSLHSGLTNGACEII